MMTKRCFIRTEVAALRLGLFPRDRLLGMSTVRALSAQRSLSASRVALSAVHRSTSELRGTRRKHPLDGAGPLRDDAAIFELVRDDLVSAGRL
jgi:hypothetical protein